MQRFSGKRLLLSEIDLPLEIVNRLEQLGKVKKESGFLDEQGKERSCRRCGTSERTLLGSHLCAKCGKLCTYCRHCLALGKVSECEFLYYFPVEPLPYSPIKESLQWNGQLSRAQEKASLAVIEAIKNRSSLLVWAVAGAGKTEILFQGLAHAFSTGLSILIATPRVDVVKELYPRLKQSFPNVRMTALFGGSKHHRQSSQLVIATTHQVMRYYEAFDVVIIDEVDAFPYSVDRSLQYAISQAKKKTAALIYLTATPSQILLKSKIDMIKIPLRYHGYPLPVPRFKWCGSWAKKLDQNKLPKQLLQWVKEMLSQKKPVLLFVPTLSILTKISPILKKEGVNHSSIHATDPQRHLAVERFRQGQLPLLVTTTILERGVTFPNVQVAVLGAEHNVFSEAALVQIAGRVGRSRHFPTGDVLFYHFGVSGAMKAAKRQIDMMNEEGARL